MGPALYVNFLLSQGSEPTVNVIVNTLVFAIKHFGTCMSFPIVCSIRRVLFLLHNQIHYGAFLLFVPFDFLYFNCE